VGRIATGGMGGRRSRSTYVLSRIHPRYVRGLLSHNDNDPLQQSAISVSVVPRLTVGSRTGCGTCPHWLPGIAPAAVVMKRWGERCHAVWGFLPTPLSCPRQHERGVGKGCKEGTIPLWAETV